MKQRTSLKTKLVLAFMLTASLVLVVGYFNLQNINTVHKSFADIIDHRLPQLAALENMRILASEAKSETLAYQLASVDAQTQKNKLLASIENLTHQEEAYISLLQQGTASEQADALASFKPVSSAKARTLSVALGLVSLKEQKASASVIAAKEADLTKAETSLEGALVEAINQQRSAVVFQDQAADNEIHRATLTAGLLAGMAATFALLLGLAISVSITRRLGRLQEGSVRIASGDFSKTIPIQSQDEVGQLAKAFNAMSSRLKESYRRLEVERLRDEAILQSIGEGLIAIDATGKIVLINPIALNFLDLKSPSDAIGKSVQDTYQLYDASDKENTPLSLEKRPSYLAFHDGISVNEVYGLHKSDGKKHLVNITANPIKSGDAIVGAITVLRDVTKEKEVDRMKTEFISLASHQLRTPLSAIKWFDEMLVSGDAGELQPEQLDFAKNIGESTERMIALVNALLNISRIESGRIMVDPKPTDLKELVSGIVNDLKGKTEEKQQSLVISVHQDLPKINLDPRLIGQVFLNLLTNAIKYTPKGGDISVFISRRGNEVISQVTDSGYGIPKEQQPRIFQKFFRATNAVKIETDGTGLGLYLIKSVVESSGGRIWFESEEGKGTTFWFSIPLSGMKAKKGEVTLDV